MTTADESEQLFCECRGCRYCGFDGYTNCISTARLTIYDGATDTDARMCELCAAEALESEPFSSLAEIDAEKPAKQTRKSPVEGSTAEDDARSSLRARGISTKLEVDSSKHREVPIQKDNMKTDYDADDDLEEDPYDTKAGRVVDDIKRALKMSIDGLPVEYPDHQWTKVHNLIYAALIEAAEINAADAVEEWLRGQCNEFRAAREKKGKQSGADAASVLDDDDEIVG